MTKRSLYLTGMTLGAFVLAVVSAGCGSDWQNYDEEYLRSGMWQPGAENVPVWVKGKVPQSENEIYFVGRGIAYNVFDERAGYDSARDHVLQQLGKQVATWISARSTESDRRTFAPGSGWLLVPGRGSGNRFLPGERSTQSQAAAVRLCTEALAGDLKDVDVYWEQWYMEETPEKLLARPLRMKRYKCWLLMSVPTKKMESRIAATLAGLKIALSGPNTLFASVGSHSAPAAGQLGAVGASQLFKMGSPAAKKPSRRGCKRKKNAPPVWDPNLDIKDEEQE